jgi:hypothetical protein
LIVRIATGDCFAVRKVTTPCSIPQFDDDFGSSRQVFVADFFNSINSGKSKKPGFLEHIKSLGGNCLTTMIATLSLEPANVIESVSTCRFAQRVALIKNEVFCLRFV